MKKRVLGLDPITNQPKPETCEKALWRAVLVQTALDATTHPRRSESNVSRSIREEAIAFIMASADATAAWYQHVCEQASVAPSYFRGFVRSFIDSGKRFMLRDPV